MKNLCDSSYLTIYGAYYKNAEQWRLKKLYLALIQSYCLLYKKTDRSNSNFKLLNSFNYIIFTFFMLILRFHFCIKTFQLFENKKINQS